MRAVYVFWSRGWCIVGLGPKSARPPARETQLNLIPISLSSKAHSPCPSFCLRLRGPHVLFLLCPGSAPMKTHSLWFSGTAGPPAPAHSAQATAGGSGWQCALSAFPGMAPMPDWNDPEVESGPTAAKDSKAREASVWKSRLHWVREGHGPCGGLCAGCCQPPLSLCFLISKLSQEWS